MKSTLLFIFFCFILTTECLGQQVLKTNPALYAIAELPTPVLNTPEFSSVFGNKDGKTLHLDGSGLMREVEFIALPKTVFKIENIINKRNTTIYKITTDDYPYPTPKGYFIDKRFVKTVDYKPPNRLKRLPVKKVIINKLLSSKGSNYIWGGNYKAGIAQMLSFYPPSPTIDTELKDRWMLKGVDCSGLLYEATNGYTPRNTSSLLSFGEPVKIADLSANQIMQKVKPLDIIVWKGHVIIILDRERTIESRLDYDKKRQGNQGGVRIRDLKEALIETLRTKIPVNNYVDEVKEGRKKFVVRRWFSIMLNKQDLGIGELRDLGIRILDMRPKV